MSEIRIIPVAGVPEIRPGDDLARAIVTAAGPGAFEPRDVLVVAQKVVSKAEGRLVADVDREGAVLEESQRVLRRSKDMYIAQTRHGFVCANAGVDSSNVPGDALALLPVDPDLSARRIRARLKELAAVDVGVVVSDTFGRAWRVGQTNVAIGLAGIEPFIDYRGSPDAHGLVLAATLICIADEVAAAAEMVMGKARGIPAAIARGVPAHFGRGAAREIVRPVAEDLFR